MKSIITFTPKRDDNGKQISCKAENPRMRAHSKEDNIFLSISCKYSSINICINTFTIIIFFRALKSFSNMTFILFYSFSDPPVLNLKWGKGLRPRNIRHGYDVYFECQVDANPKVETVEWYHGVR